MRDPVTHIEVWCNKKAAPILDRGGNKLLAEFFGEEKEIGKINHAVLIEIKLSVGRGNRLTKSRGEQKIVIQTNLATAVKVG